MGFWVLSPVGIVPIFGEDKYQTKNEKEEIGLSVNSFLVLPPHYENKAERCTKRSTAFSLRRALLAIKRTICGLVLDSTNRFERDSVQVSIWTRRLNTNYV